MSKKEKPQRFFRFIRIRGYDPGVYHLMSKTLFDAPEAGHTGLADIRVGDQKARFVVAWFNPSESRCYVAPLVLRRHGIDIDAAKL